MREINLNASTAGMTRLRPKGGASPESLYELYNGYINASKIPQQRPCAAYKFSVPTTSKGLVLYKGTFYTFTALPVAVVPGSTNLVLRHPNGAYNGTLKQIHFAQPYMSYLYVVVEFNADGTIPGGIYHYWLQFPATFQKSTQYKANDLVQPAVPNGFYYRALQSESAALSWAAGVVHIWNDVVQPSVYNGFQYRAKYINGNGMYLSGERAASGQVEPIWPTEIGATVIEVSSGAVNVEPPAAPEPPDPIPPGMRDGGGIDSRYQNPGGSGTIPWARTGIRIR